MHKLDPYGRVINEYGQEMGFNHYTQLGNNWDNQTTKLEIKVEQPKEKENKHKYILIRR